MPRRARIDFPGSWHHVMNRGVARRTLFESPKDFRFFTAQLAKAVRRGEIEVHCFCLMSTHYHLLVKSPRSDLAKAMHRIQNAYSRWFNRSRKRDGGLVRARYTSKPVTTFEYRRTLIRYIDDNPCKAHLVMRAFQYRFGSAVLYAREKGPLWLERSWVEERVLAQTGSLHYDPVNYTRTFSRLPAGMEDLVRARSAHYRADDPLDNLVTSSSRQIREWMQRKARLADGTKPGIPILSFSRLQVAIMLQRGEIWELPHGKVKRNAWDVLLVGLGRELCGSTLAVLGSQLALSATKASRLNELHQRELLAGGEYSERAAILVHAVVRCQAPTHHFTKQGPGPAS